MAQTCTITSLASGMALTVEEGGALTVTPATGDVNQQFLITYGEAGAMRIAAAAMPTCYLFVGGTGKSLQAISIIDSMVKYFLVIPDFS